MVGVNLNLVRLCTLVSRTPTLDSEPVPKETLTDPALLTVVPWNLMLRCFRQVVFLALILLKGFSYSLNNPCKEILYQPTNSAVKFKSKVGPARLTNRDTPQNHNPKCPYSGNPFETISPAFFFSSCIR